MAVEEIRGRAEDLQPTVVPQEAMDLVGQHQLLERHALLAQCSASVTVSANETLRSSSPCTSSTGERQPCDKRQRRRS